MRTARLLTVSHVPGGGGLSNHPWMQTLLNHVTCDASWKANLLPPPPVDRMTDACENMTLP